MTLKPKQGWFLAFTAVFAVLAGFVFWGAWAPDMVPVMPDCPTSFPVDYAEDWIRGWKQNGKFVPGDLVAFLGDPLFWVELKYVLATYCAALGMFYFLRGRGLSRVASYGAGLLLAFSGYWLTLFSAGHLGWFQWMTYGVFAFGLIDRAFEKGRLRHWLLLGAVLAWGSFYQPDLWLLFTVFTVVYFVFRWICTAVGSRIGEGKVPSPPIWKSFFSLKWVKGAGIALASFLLIGLSSFRSAICSDLAGRDRQIAEGQTIGEGEEGEDARWEFVTNWSLPPEDTVEFFNARVRGDTSCAMTLAVGQDRGNGIRPYTGRLGCPKSLEGESDKIVNYRQHSLYVGWLTCVLSLLGLVSPVVLRLVPVRRASDPLDGTAPRHHNTAFVLFFACAAVVFYLFSLGRFCDAVYRFVYRLPMGDYLRAPVKWHHLTEFCLVVLAGLGLELIFRLLSRTKLSVLVVTGICSAVALVGAVDLARQDKLFCAPHRASTMLGLAVPLPNELYQQLAASCAMQGVRLDPRDRRSFASILDHFGFVAVGWMDLQQPDGLGGVLRYSWPFIADKRNFLREVAVVERPVSRDDAGQVKEEHVIECKAGTPKVRKVENELQGAAHWLAMLSVLATLSVLGFLVAAQFNKRLDKLTLK